MRLTDAGLLLLLARIAEGDQDALAELYRFTFDSLSSFIRRLVRDAWTAEEVLQDVYKHVWLNAATYSADRGVPWAWLYMIARSRALDSLRRGKKGPSLVTLDRDLCPVSCNDAWLSSLIRRRVKDLPPKQRRLIHMAFYEGYSHSEIAVETGLPLGTVKARIRNALTRLREGLPPEPASRGASAAA